MNEIVSQQVNIILVFSGHQIHPEDTYKLIGYSTTVTAFCQCIYNVYISAYQSDKTLWANVLMCRYTIDVIQVNVPILPLYRFDV